MWTERVMSTVAALTDIYHSTHVIIQPITVRLIWNEKNFPREDEKEHEKHSAINSL